MVQVLAKGEDDDGGILGFLSDVFNFLFGTVFPLVTSSDALSDACNGLLDCFSIVDQCDCVATPTFFPPAVSADVTCPLFDTCPDNMGFACGECDVTVGGTGALFGPTLADGPTLDGILGAKCTVQSPLLEHVSIMTEGTVGLGTSGFTVDACTVSAALKGGFEVASCSCAVDPSCGPMGVSFTCAVASIPLFASGGCVNLDSFRQ